MSGLRPQTPFEELDAAIKESERVPGETSVLVSLALAKQIRDLLYKIYEEVEAVNA